MFAIMDNVNMAALGVCRPMSLVLSHVDLNQLAASKLHLNKEVCMYV